MSGPKTKQAFERLAISMGANIWRPLVDDGGDEALAILLDGAADEIDAMKAWRRDFGELKEAVGDESGLVRNIAAGAVRRIAELEAELTRAKFPPPSACMDRDRLASISPETVRSWLKDRGWRCSP